MGSTHTRLETLDRPVERIARSYVERARGGAGTSVDFWEGVVGMPLFFEQPNLDQSDQNHLYSDPGEAADHGLASHADLPRQGHNLRVARGACNIAEERLADAIAILSRKPAADRKNGA